MTMLKYFNEVGVFKNDNVWFPTYYTYNVCWNYSDGSLALAKVGIKEVCFIKIMYTFGHTLCLY